MSRAILGLIGPAENKADVAELVRLEPIIPGTLDNGRPDVMPPSHPMNGGPSFSPVLGPFSLLARVKAQAAPGESVRFGARYALDAGVESEAIGPATPSGGVRGCASNIGAFVWGGILLVP